jgi:hypothetical protein
LANLAQNVTAAGFIELTHYHRPPSLPREQQPWLASVWRKAGPAMSRFWTAASALPRSFASPEAEEA